MKEPNDDFLNHIISTLRKHEEPYEEGAWERFKTARKVETKARPVIIGLWKWGAAAAAAVTAIFLISKIYFSSNNNIDTNLPINIVTNNTEKITKDSGKTTAIAASPEVKKYGEAEHQKSPVARIIATPANRTAANINHENINDISTSAPSPFITTPSRQPATLPEVAQQEPPKKNDRIDFWRNKIIEGNEQPKQTTIKPENNILLSTTQPSIKQVPSKEKNKRWQPSLYVSPLFNDQGVDMGYGFSLGYAINDKIKISSGIAHTKLSASHSYDADIPMSSPVSAALSESKNTLKAAYSFNAPQETSTLQHVDGLLSGIDIPVEINYSFNNKIYAAAGISGLIVLDDRKKYTYVDNRNVKVSVETNKGSLKEDKSVTFSDYNTTSIPVETPKETTPFLGFYNLSVGYKQKIFNKNSVSLEPFIKIPMKSVTQQNLNYMGSGIRVKFDF